jgi:ABC-2 type transport system ATP-binding protein
MCSRELLEYHCRFYDIYDYSEIKRLANIFKLDLDRKITDLSFGNRKKCGIIQSLIHKPKLLIMDEPTSGLDPLMQSIFFEMLRDEHKKGTTIFFSSHILSEVQNLCERAAIIKDGEIKATENIQTLRKKQMKKVTVVFGQKLEKLKFIEGIQNQHWQGSKLTFEYVGPISDLLKWISDLDIIDVVLEEPDLESIFMNYY